MTALWTLIAGAVAALLVWAWSSRGAVGSDRLAVCVVLATLASVYNVVVPIPNVEATTTVVVCAAMVVGVRMAITVGALAVIASSLALGLGTWTPWQVLGFAIVALLAVAGAPVLGYAERVGTSWAPAAVLACVAGLACVAYDAVVTLGTTFAAGLPLGVGTLLLGAAFTLVHVAGSAALTALVGPTLVSALRRARLRLDRSVRPMPAPGAARLLR